MDRVPNVTWACVEQGMSAAMRWLRVAIAVTVLLVGLGATLAPVRAGAIPYAACASASMLTTVDIYVYQGNDDTPVLMPLAVINDINVYTDSTFATWIGTVAEDDSIVDANNNVVGYVVYPSPG